MKLWGGRYHLDPAGFVIVRLRSFLMPWIFKREWGVYFTEGEPEPHKFHESAQTSENRTAWAISAAMDSTWIEQALRRPGFDWRIAVIIGLTGLTLILAVGAIA